MSLLASAPRRRRNSRRRRVLPSGREGPRGYWPHLPLGSKSQPLSDGAGAATQRPSGSKAQPLGAASHRGGAGAASFLSVLLPFPAQSVERTPRSQPLKSHGMGTAPAGAAAESRTINAAARGKTDRRKRNVDIENLPFRGAIDSVRNGEHMRLRGEYGVTGRGNLPSKRLVSARFAPSLGVDKAE